MSIVYKSEVIFRSIEREEDCESGIAANSMMPTASYADSFTLKFSL